MIVHDTLLAFLMYFHFVLLDYTHFFDEMSYFFIFLIFLNLIKFLLLMNLHFYSSFSTWMIFHGILCLLCLWWISTLSQLDENSYILFSLFFFMLVSFLSWWPSLFAHSLMFSQSLISPWWISFLPSFDEVKYPFFCWTLFSKLDELFIGLIVFIEDLTKWCWIHKVNTSSSRNIKHAYLISPTKV